MVLRSAVLEIRGSLGLEVSRYPGYDREAGELQLYSAMCDA